MLTTAGIWRRLMFRTTFIAVSGSVGKSTAKDAIALVLGEHFCTHKTSGSANHYDGVVRSLLSVRPWHRYAVIEIGLDRPGQMKRFARTVKPDIAVWVNVARTHTQSFRTLEVIAREKSLLVESLRPGGIAILNCDNPFISAYQPPSFAKIIRYGEGEGMHWQASQVTSKWPNRLSFHVSGKGENGLVKTKLVGKHWVPSLLPAIALGTEVGLSLDQTIAALAGIEPMQQRLSPATTPQGATFLRDEFNASADTLKVALDVLEEAEAQRKIIVFSGMSDSGQSDARRFRGVGQSAAKVADLAIFVGDRSKHSLKGAVDAGMDPLCVSAFYDLQSAAEYLRSELKSGDLVLLRGLRQDHMSRAYLAMLDNVDCWVSTCHRKHSCDVCPDLKSNPQNKLTRVQGE